jgi:hypothetical protein
MAVLKRKIIKGARILAWCIGLMFGIARILVYYGTGPFIVYLMIKYLT